MGTRPLGLYIWEYIPKYIPCQPLFWLVCAALPRPILSGAREPKTRGVLTALESVRAHQGVSVLR